jgi:bifunctional DNA-binding transcriptional regulator/antitoxin component of YhaV-PrlF toxin-antitoxin module
MKLQKSPHDQYYITLPKTMVEAKGWQKGQELMIEFGPRGEFILKEKPPEK